MSNPRDTLRTLIDQDFCYDYLVRIERAVAALPVNSAEDEVANFVIGRVCFSLHDYMDATEETMWVARHDGLEASIIGPLRVALRHLAAGTPISSQQLADLIFAAAAIRSAPLAPK